MRANFEFLDKLGVDKWCFHDRDIAPEGKTLEVSKFLVTDRQEWITCLCILGFGK